MNKLSYSSESTVDPKVWGWEPGHLQLLATQGVSSLDFSTRELCSSLWDDPLPPILCCDWVKEMCKTYFCPGQMLAPARCSHGLPIGE